MAKYNANYSTLEKAKDNLKFKGITPVAPREISDGKWNKLQDQVGELRNKNKILFIVVVVEPIIFCILFWMSR